MSLPEGSESPAGSMPDLQSVDVGEPNWADGTEAPPSSYGSMKSDENSVTSEIPEEEKEDPAAAASSGVGLMQSSDLEEDAGMPNSATEDATLELPYIFKSIQKTLNNLSEMKLLLFKMCLLKHHAEYFEGHLDKNADILDIVDKMLERCGKGGALNVTLRVLHDIKVHDLAEELEKSCIRLRLQHDLKTCLKRRYDCIFEGIARQGNQSFLSYVYTDMQMVSDRNAVNREHEVRQDETSHGNQVRQGTAIPCSDIFRCLPGQYKPVRNVLTTGIAGIGLTVCVQKYILDWTEEKPNQDIHFIFPLPFRELNLIKEDRISLRDLICIFFPDMKEMDFIEKKDCRVLFILDGLDVCKLPLNFQENDKVSDIEQRTTPQVLLTNLMLGNLLPSAHVWITSRSAAANLIPFECVHWYTELCGFNDDQKKAYFTQKFKDPAQLCQVLSRVTSARSLHIMCHIPVFCWIVATVFERKFADPDRTVITTLTQFYTHYLVLQLHMKNQKYYGMKAGLQQWQDTDPEFVLKLAKLAFEQLEKDRFVFHEVDLREYGLGFRDVVLHSGLCTEIYKQDSCQEREFCFVHQTLQEYLAALHVHYTFLNRHQNVLGQPLKNTISKIFKPAPMCDLYKTAIERAMQSGDGHLDLFLRFLFGLSEHSTQEILRGLLKRMGVAPPVPEEMTNYIEKLRSENSNPERCGNLAHCLRELQLS
ncbi:NLR family CARD domain-containing protein 3-like [Paramormyrops kingsleyae]|uniref:NLR family CARD domain-containing protein 3-like n=1 Tax=Paramormyrops kingsleyae TaxID=1676925 RepID=UPI003B972415